MRINVSDFVASLSASLVEEIRNGRGEQYRLEGMLLDHIRRRGAVSPLPPCAQTERGLPGVERDPNGYDPL